MKLANCMAPGCQAIVPMPALLCIAHRGEEALQKLEDIVAGGGGMKEISGALRHLHDLDAPTERINQAAKFGRRRFLADQQRRREEAGAAEPERPGGW